MGEDYIITKMDDLRFGDDVSINLNDILICSCGGNEK